MKITEYNPIVGVIPKEAGVGASQAFFPYNNDKDLRPVLACHGSVVVLVVIGQLHARSVNQPITNSRSLSAVHVQPPAPIASCWPPPSHTGPLLQGWQYW